MEKVLVYKSEETRSLTECGVGTLDSLWVPDPRLSSSIRRQMTRQEVQHTGLFEGKTRLLGRLARERIMPIKRDLLLCKPQFEQLELSKVLEEQIPRRRVRSCTGDGISPASSEERKFLGVAVGTFAVRVGDGMSERGGKVCFCCCLAREGDEGMLVGHG
jgi:hypothetical protein